MTSFGKGINTVAPVLNSSTLFDLLLLVFFIFFEPRLGNYLSAILNDGAAVDQQTAGYIFLSASLAQTIGTILRMKWASAHLQHTNKKTGTGGFVGAIFLIVMHLTLFGFMMTFDGVRYIAGDDYDSTWGKFPLIVIPFLFAFLPTAMIIMASFPGSKKIEFPENKRDVLLDFAGCILLLYSACVITTIYWQLLVEAAGTSLHTDQLIVNLLITLLLFFTFLLLYLPARYMFLISDYHYRSTWIRIVIVYLPFGYAIMSGKYLN